MQTLKAKVLSVLQFPPYRIDSASEDQSKHVLPAIWQMRVSYSGPQTLYEVNLRPPLKVLASKRIAAGLNGIVEFEMLSKPGISAGDFIEIDVYEFGEKILNGDKTST